MIEHFHSDDKITLGRVTIAGPGLGAKVRERFLAETERIFQAHGRRAFEAPKRAAAIHEAGHAVIATALQDERVKRVRIWRRTFEDNPIIVAGWFGLTEYHGGGWALDHQTSRPADLIRPARNLYAGIAGEALFAGDDLREASSLDEVMMSQLLGAQAADLLGLDGKTYWREEVHNKVCRHLLANQTVVMRIADYLLEHRKLQGRPLERMLAGVWA
jgi:hypothetical protein